jgi:hypothetical protein
MSVLGVNVGRPNFKEACGPQAANARKAPFTEECRERDVPLKDSPDRIPMTLKLIMAGLMGASRG